MLVTTKAEYDNQGQLIHWEGFRYEGSVAMCGGGPSREQRNAAAAQANLANTQSNTSNRTEQMVEDQYHAVTPFGTDLMKNGLPYMNALTDYNNGTTANAALAPRASLLRSMGGNDASMPNGFKTAALGDFNNQLASGFDSNMTNALNQNEQAKLQGAGLLTGQQGAMNPLGWSQAASGSNNSIMQAPLATPSPFGAVMGALGSVGQGIASNPSVKF